MSSSKLKGIIFQCHNDMVQVLFAFLYLTRDFALTCSTFHSIPFHFFFANIHNLNFQYKEAIRSQGLRDPSLPHATSQPALDTHRDFFRKRKTQVRLIPYSQQTIFSRPSQKARQFLQGEAPPLHTGWADPYDYSKRG